jgi:RNA polymerase sigma factor (sigma-70 family)
MTEVADTLRRAAGGDELAWRELVGRYSGMLRSIARTFRLGAADVEDASQATWTLLVQHADEIRDPARIGGWLACTMRRECIRMTARNRHEVPVPETVDDPHSLADAADQPLLRSERAELVRSALARLPVRQRELLLALSPDPAPSYCDIAEVLSMAVGTIGPTRAKALRRMRDLLSGMIPSGALDLAS